MQRIGADRLRILVTDTGPGIAAERLQELFQPFSRLDAAKSSIEGTGIGLSITRHIVEMMGGTVNVESKVGVGSTFWIELPLESIDNSIPADGSVQSQKEVAADTTQAAETEQVERTILYIEDNLSNLRLVTQILSSRKHIRLLTAHNAEFGIELAISYRPDLILLDINMPDMDGYQVLQAFKMTATSSSYRWLP